MIKLIKSVRRMRKLNRRLIPEPIRVGNTWYKDEKKWALMNAEYNHLYFEIVAYGRWVFRFLQWLKII